MLPGFQSKIFEVATEDGRNFKLIKPVRFLARDGTLYELPEGAPSDGASTPPEIWPSIPPFGLYWPAAYLHDCAYQNTLRVIADTGWTLADLPKGKCDGLLREAMQSLGVPLELVYAIYDGVTIGGQNAFNNDRS